MEYSWQRSSGEKAWGYPMVDPSWHCGSEFFYLCQKPETENLMEDRQLSAENFVVLHSAPPISLLPFLSSSSLHPASSTTLHQFLMPPSFSYLSPSSSFSVSHFSCSSYLHHPVIPPSPHSLSPPLPWEQDTAPVFPVTASCPAEHHQVFFFFFFLKWVKWVFSAYWLLVNLFHL